MLKLKTNSQAFTRDERGGVTILFAISCIAVFVIMGIAIDSARYQDISSRAQAALDGAALSAAKMLEDEAVATRDVQQRIKTFFDEAIPTFGVDVSYISPVTANIDRDENSVEAIVQIRMPSLFGTLAGLDRMTTINRASKVVYDMDKVELSLVLDVTGSMNDNGKIAGLKTAAKSIVDILNDPTRLSLVRIALVPYSASVNVGPYADAVSGGDSLDGCVMERLNPANLNTDEPPGGSNNYAVKGQLNSASNSKYSCPAATILPLTKDPDTLKTAIDSYVAQGATAGHIGLAFGWNAVSEKWAGNFTGANAPGLSTDPNIKKAILLMTDGKFNTSYTAGTDDAGQVAESTARTLALCNNIKGQNIRIFTVAFEAPVEAETLLRSCASTPSDYFDANNSAQLNDAFTTIAKSLQVLRVAQ